MAKKLYCYETRQEFSSLVKASENVKITPSTLSEVVNKSDRTAGGYHWCTDLSIFDGVELSGGYKTEVFCYETREKFESMADAAKWCGSLSISYISKVLNNPNKTSGGYHWCSNLSIFDGVELSGGSKEVYCYETEQRFESVKSAANFLNLDSSYLSKVIDIPNKTCGGYHWCTDLSIFDGVELKTGPESVRQSVFCYETEERFKSVSEAATFYNLSSPSSIFEVIDKPNRTSANYHWCTDPSIFEGVEITFPENGKSKVIFCYETKQQFKSIVEASNHLGVSFSLVRTTLNDPNKTAGGYHWCTDLSIFDGCDLIYPSNSNSAKEKQLANHTKLIYSGEVIENSKKIINPLELDIFIPEKNLAIEFNGNYWHSEKYKHKNYHIGKTNLCRDRGIQLIHIFEHQWLNKSEIFKSVIANKLGLSNKIYARKCKVIELDNCKEFLDTNHLQGNCSSSVKLGLVYNDELVSVMTLGKPRFNKYYEYELIRFCNKLGTTVIGGASKLLNYFEKKYLPKSIISYANLQWSDGDVYKNLGFTELSISEPNYWWTKGHLTLTRYQCQKHKLGSLLGESFNQDLSEKENMERAGYSRLFDCGNMVFVK